MGGASVAGLSPVVAFTTTTPELYHCKTDLVHWESGWSIMKKRWCCAKRGVGCPTPPVTSKQTFWMGKSEQHFEEESIRITGRRLQVLVASFCSGSLSLLVVFVI